MPSVLRNSPGPPESDETIIRRTRKTTYTHGRAWLPWLLSALLVPLALAWLWLYPFGGRDRIQDDLSGKARNALAAAGFSGAGLKFSGADATLCGIAAGQEDAARKAVEAVGGIGAVRIAAAGDTSCGPVGGGTGPVNLSFSKNDGRLVLKGSVPDEASWTEVVTAATASAGGLMVADELTVQPGVQLPANTTPTAIGNVAGTVATLPGDVNLAWDGNALTLSGTVPTEADKAAAEQAVKAIVPEANVVNQLAVSGSGNQGGGGVTPDKAALQQQIDAALQSTPVTFEPETATLTGQGSQTLQQIAPLLAAAPDVALKVSGHVAAANSPTDGQALSLQRAETVKQRLVELGIPADKITAEGLGDSDPIASNDTPEGQALNRRVEITVQ